MLLVTISNTVQLIKNHLYLCYMINNKKFKAG